jgi:arylsulfatase A-like enzyme
MGLTRRKALGRLVGGFGGLALAQNKPNIVVILADDLGYCDTELFGCTGIPTPNIKSIAREGVLFSSGYVAAPVCSPSRAALLTGRYQQRFGFEFNAGALERALANQEMGLPVSEITLPEVLKRAGYATGMVGKWHLGWDAGDMPIHHGFDFYYGVPAGEDESDFILGDQPTRDTVSPDQFARRYTDVALKFMASQPRDRRFFMYIAHRDPHLDNFPSPEFAGRSAAGAYGDVIEQLDATVGDVMKWLRDAGLDQNTLVIFMSDNGPVIPPKGPGSAGPWSGGKFSCEEGGVRVPAIMRWPTRIRAGRVVDEIVSSLDLFPTLVALTGATLPPRSMDGQDVSTLVTGEVDRIPGRGIDGGREVVFSAQTGAAGLRSGKWKYLRPGIWSGSTTLFDLQADPAEKQDQSRARPDLVKQLEARLQELIR